MLDYMLLNLRLWKAKFFGEESGAVDLIVIVILIAVVVVLGIAFKDKIVELISSLFDDAEKTSKEAGQKVSF